MREIPKEWIKCILNDVVIKLESGSRPKGGVRNITEGIPSIGGEHLNYNGGFNFSNLRFVPITFAERMSKGHIQRGDILIVKDGATTGKTSLVNKIFPYEIAVVNEHVFICRTSNAIESKFVFRFLTSKEGQNNILANFQGSAQGGINQTFATNTIIPIAPLNEQKRIVEKLDKLITKVDEAKERLDQIPIILKRFRQSVLNAAVTGELTKDWREKNPDVKSGESVYQKIQKHIDVWYLEKCKIDLKDGKRKPRDQRKNPKSRYIIGENELINLPLNWMYARLEDLSYLVSDGTHKTPKYCSEGIKFLSVKNVRPFKLKDDDVKYISHDEFEFINSRCNPENGDVLYTKVGATFGYAAQINLNYNFSIFVSLALIKPVKKYFTSDYCELVMNSELVFDQARKRISGIGTPDLHLIEIRDFRISFPSVEEQIEIVKRVDVLFKTADEIEDRYKKAKAYVDKLTQSILAKAFRGELVPQDPNDEPAEKLLEKIREEKEKIEKKGSGKQR